ncbi:unnamed protein product [Lampetra planeri]
MTDGAMRDRGEDRRGDDGQGDDGQGEDRGGRGRSPWERTTVAPLELGSPRVQSKHGAARPQEMESHWPLRLNSKQFRGHPPA